MTIHNDCNSRLHNAFPTCIHVVQRGKNCSEQNRPKIYATQDIYHVWQAILKTICQQGALKMVECAHTNTQKKHI